MIGSTFNQIMSRRASPCDVLGRLVCRPGARPCTGAQGPPPAVPRTAAAHPDTLHSSGRTGPARRLRPPGGAGQDRTRPAVSSAARQGHRGASAPRRKVELSTGFRDFPSPTTACAHARPGRPGTRSTPYGRRADGSDGSVTALSGAPPGAPAEDRLRCRAGGLAAVPGDPRPPARDVDRGLRTAGRGPPAAAVTGASRGRASRRRGAPHDRSAGAARRCPVTLRGPLPGRPPAPARRRVTGPAAGDRMIMDPSVAPPAHRDRVPRR